MASKTFAQLNVSATLADGDLLANFRGAGPLTSITTQVMRTYLNTYYLQGTNNLSDLANAATARTNLGLLSAATHAATDFALSALTFTAGSGLTGGGDLTANRSFAVDINGLAADASPDVAADYVMTYDASAAGLKKVLLNNLPVPLAQIASFTISGTPTTVSFTSIPQGYREIIVVLQDVVVQAGTNNVNIAASTNNGGAYSPSLSIISSPSAHNTGIIRFALYSKGYGALTFQVGTQAGAFSSPRVDFGGSPGGSGFVATGGINAIQLSATGATPAFTSGTVVVYGL